MTSASRVARGLAVLGRPKPVQFAPRIKVQTVHPSVGTGALRRCIESRILSLL